MLILDLTIAVSILSALTSGVSFILYALARMHEQESKEKLYRSIHFTSLLVFVILGVLILIQVSNRVD